MKLCRIRLSATYTLRWAWVLDLTSNLAEPIVIVIDLPLQAFLVD